LKLQLEKSKSDEKKDEEISNLKQEIEFLKSEFSTQTKDLKDSFQIKSELETTLYETLMKQKELQDTFYKKYKESEKNLKEKIKDFEIEKENLSSKLLETTKLLQETNETLQKYENENTQLQTEIQNSKTTNPIDTQIAEKLKKAVEHIEGLQKNLEEQKTNSREIEKNNKEKIQFLQEENTKFKIQIEKLEKEQKDHVDEIEKLIIAVKKKEEELKSKFMSKHKTISNDSLTPREDNSPVTKTFKKSPRTFEINKTSNNSPITPRGSMTPQTPREVEKDPSGWKSLLKKTSVPKMEKKEIPKVNQIDFRSVLKKKSGEGETPRNLDSQRSPKDSDSNDNPIKSPK